MPERPFPAPYALGALQREIKQTLTGLPAQADFEVFAAIYPAAVPIACDGRVTCAKGSRYLIPVRINVR
ncbi:hypothetical protein J2Y48_001905 [Mycoplana sp. BE70]|nr:hypothetical protein [Mycoplana sp. BE70]